MWRDLSLRAPACSRGSARRAVWLELWPLVQGRVPSGAMARLHPVHRAKATERLCELGAAWCRSSRFPRDEEREMELWLWEAAHAGEGQAMRKWTETKWSDDFCRSPTQRFAELLLQSGREDDAALRWLWRALEEDRFLAWGADSSRADEAAGRLFARAAQEEEGWRLKMRLRELLHPSTRTGSVW